VIDAFQVLTNGMDQWMLRNKKEDTNHIHSILFSVYKALEQEEYFTILPEATQIVESAREYICTHYQEPLSLAQVADYLNVNPSYLSDLFHKNIGETYTKFVTRIRMEQAVLLMKSNPHEKIYRIAEKTGF